MTRSGKVGALPDLVRVCTKCGAEKPLDDFYKSSSGRLGRTARCKACIKKYQAERYASNPGPAITRANEWSAKNPERAADNKRRYARRNPRKRVEQTERWRRENLAYYQQYNLAYTALKRGSSRRR